MLLRLRTSPAERSLAFGRNEKAATDRSTFVGTRTASVDRLGIDTMLEHPVTRSLDPTGTGTMGDQMEAHPERLRHRIRRTNQPMNARPDPPLNRRTVPLIGRR